MPGRVTSVAAEDPIVEASDQHLMVVRNSGSRHIPLGGTGVHAIMAADARNIPTAGISIQAKRKSNGRRGKMYSAMEIRVRAKRGDNH